MDGSPPCSSFSISGNREQDWGENKVFREGQSEQILDTLFFDFIDLAKRLQPKIVIAENVKGLLLGNAIKYVRTIYKQFEEAGYYCQHWILDSSTMGIPQKRERVFFVCLRKDLADRFLYQADMFTILPKLKLEFNLPEIHFKEIEQTETKFNQKNCTEDQKKWWELTDPGDSFSTNHPTGAWFNAQKVAPNKVIPTIVAAARSGGGSLYHYSIPRHLHIEEFQLGGSWPMDYNFLDYSKDNPVYIIGMSVPPLMIANIADQVYDQWLSKLPAKEPIPEPKKILIKPQQLELFV